MVTDTNGDQAYVVIYENSFADLTAFERARHRAMAAEAAADAGALRSALKFSVTSPERLQSQKRVLTCSLAAADGSSKAVRVRIGALRPDPTQNDG